MPFEELLAFSAGMVTAFNPCGVALLPSYLAYLLSGRVESGRFGWLDGLRSGILMTLGFVVLFGVAGLLVGVVGQAVFMVAPVVSLLLAVGLLVLAVFVWKGHLGWSLALGQTGTKLERIFRRGSRLSFFAYGVSYGLASLSCSLPVFLAVSAQGMAGGIGHGSVIFVYYTAGMGAVVTLLSMLATSARHLVQHIIRQALPAVQKLSAMVMVASSGYLFWYWIWGPGVRTIFG
ncbi:MAG: cytochrome c biogenesis CcdA family protein [Sulfobacillus sp.]